MGNQGGKALKWLPAHFNFYGSVSTSSGHFGAVARLCQQRHFVPKWLVAVLPLPGYSFSDGHSFFKVQLIDELP
ncbi:hypothetical protein HOLDEFILI_03606 [Holdemania filiformis DSM 12042]|uniref:Uncharacterized protein n=1 Tax=Holdemania filiformis DSM 12042 TaxID=545696 RepID=B9YCP5_9FIRM|nr:hypothetical protein HOLDEFILI_03606 [Holdemania filiformis DSM 12042]